MDGKSFWLWALFIFVLWLFWFLLRFLFGFLLWFWFWILFLLLFWHLFLILFLLFFFRIVSCPEYQTPNSHIRRPFLNLPYISTTYRFLKIPTHSHTNLQILTLNSILLHKLLLQLHHFLKCFQITLLSYRHKTSKTIHYRYRIYFKFGHFYLMNKYKGYS